MRIVFDTNVLISAFISHGTCAEILEYCAYRHELVTSGFIMKELRRNLITKFKFSHREATEATQLLMSYMQVVTPCDLGGKVCRDSTDDLILGTAAAGRCDCIITGDHDLLDLKQCQGIDVVSPHDFWKYESRS